jgi:hypothetical protein
MILGEKSASLPGKNLRPAEVSDFAVSGCAYAFSDVVDEACERLIELQIKHSIRRIQRMEETLTGLEKELDDFLEKSSFPKKPNFIHQSKNRKMG